MALPHVPLVYTEAQPLGWIDIPCYKSVVHTVSRVVSRFFVGSKLSRFLWRQIEFPMTHYLHLGANPKYTDLMQGYTYHVGRCGVIIRLLPTWLKPYVSIDAKVLVVQSHTVHPVSSIKPCSILRQNFVRSKVIYGPSLWNALRRVSWTKPILSP